MGGWRPCFLFQKFQGRRGAIPSLLQASQCSPNLVLPLPHLFVTSTSQPASEEDTSRNGGLCHCASDNQSQARKCDAFCAHREWYFLGSYRTIVLRSA